LSGAGFIGLRVEITAMHDGQEPPPGRWQGVVRAVTPSTTIGGTNTGELVFWIELDSTHAIERVASDGGYGLRRIRVIVDDGRHCSKHRRFVAMCTRCRASIDLPPL